ncbi:hypothetical protein AS9A_3470 [Hoyosella subflava DQS3-9A1]|uniref:YobI-like P-loop NTPase domain-containing protein n=1 Tax=Hoyosella subflava (strain DSM 45089 / JCM 17490 / NBRC 109087 / DQS3-9A1) TaxID=443218 RepID=F6EQN3_HOYSD|nr:hypothetical protein AS9A_3470 [Hoyosella subflava DQS3-9A1]
MPVLRSLGPKYEEDLHGRNAAVLLNVLTGKPATTAKNIALAGHYGSGKSSVILGVQRSLDERKISWVNLSLSSLGIDDTKRARVQQDGSLAPLTNLIQKEIVKQLLYRKSPADMPGSRYFRIDSFRPWPALIWGGVVAVGFFVIAVLLGLVNRVEEMAPTGLVDSHGWVTWVTVGAFGAFLGGVWFLGLRALQSRIRVESVSAGGAAVKLSAKENSYFDEYLDEIVYFFQRTRTKVAIFEDLDRFKDPHIFETLRELNTVLNNSEQIKSRPVQFVYAVRDSIFEELEVDAESDGDNAKTSALHASTLESAPSANRTKFFDLVVPMVPFITHRSARDLLAAEFAEAEHRPSTALVNLVGAHLTDMRVIRNIRNEYEIYRASVLGEKGLKGLTADRLFAMMVYKNLHLEDFEAIRLGKSKIDEAHRMFHKMVEYQTRHQAAHSKKALDRVGAKSLWDKHAMAAGERLQKVLPIVSRGTGRGGKLGLRYQSEDYDLSSLTSRDFWRSLYENRDEVQLLRPGAGGMKLSFDDLIALVGNGTDGLDVAVEVDVARLQRDSRVALETKDFVVKATMAELMARTDLVMPTEGGDEHNLDAIITDLVSPLARDLLAKGYIDENFTLYCSDYHDIAISVSAMNFILHCVQADRAAPHFQFDEESSIEAVEKEMGARFLDGESIFNVDVFDYYLTTHPERLNTAINKLAVRSGDDSSFLDAYLIDGDAHEVLISRLATRWDGVFVHLVEKAPLELEVIVALVDTAIRSAACDTDYESSDRVAEFVSEHYAQMRAFLGGMDAAKATDVMALLRRLGAQIGDLGVLGEAQRNAAVAVGLYPVTRANLSAALDENTGLALDVVKATDEAVYKHMLANLEDYLDVLEKDEVTVESPHEFVAVLGDVADAAEFAVRPIAERASISCEVIDLTDLSDEAWGPLVSAGRFTPTVWNVSQFVSKFGVSKELVESLGTLNLTKAEEVEEEPRLGLGYALANSDPLDAATIARLLGQLNLPDGLDPAQLSDAGLAQLPALLAEDLVPDTADTYVLVSDHPFTFREEYFAASKQLASYVCELPLSSEDLARVMRSRRLAPAVKRAIADDAKFVSDRLSRQSVIAVCEWAAKGNNVSVELLVTLAKAGAPAEHILGLLEPHLPGIELVALDQILLGLGDKYEPLTRTGRHRPRLKDRAGTEELLEELRRRNRVSSFGPTKWIGGIQVNMRH